MAVKDLGLPLESFPVTEAVDSFSGQERQSVDRAGNSLHSPNVCRYTLSKSSPQTSREGATMKSMNPIGAKFCTKKERKDKLEENIASSSETEEKTGNSSLSTFP